MVVTRINHDDSCSQLNLTLLHRRIVLTADFIFEKNPIPALSATKAQCREYWTLLVPVQVEKDLERQVKTDCGYINIPNDNSNNHV